MAGNRFPSVRNCAPSPSVIRDDVEHGSPAAVRAPHSGVRACRGSAAGPLVTVEATWRPVPRGNVPQRRRHRSRRARSTRSNRSRRRSIGQRTRRSTPTGPRWPSPTSRPSGRGRSSGVPDRVRRPGADLHLRDARGPGADLLVRRRDRPAGPALRRDPRRSSVRTSARPDRAQKRDTGKWHVTWPRATLTAE